MLPWSRVLTDVVGLDGAHELWWWCAAGLAERELVLERNVERNPHGFSRWTTRPCWSRDVDVWAGTSDWPSEFQYDHSFSEHVDFGYDHINDCVDADC